MEINLFYDRERLLKSSRNFLWKGAIHEAITPSGNICYSDIAILHKKLKVNDPDRSLKIFEKMIANGKILDTRQRFYYARELYFHQKYSEAIEVFRTLFEWWIENSISACLDLSRCYTELDGSLIRWIVFLKAFYMDSQRAEIWCEIYCIKLKQQKYHEAIFWYELASKNGVSSW